MSNITKELDVNYKSNWEFTVDEQDTIDNFRNIGYDIEEAIGDIVDNSIDAGASKIFIEYSFRSDNNQGYVVVMDNGKGMNREELTNAFSYKKNEGAESNRLGFFGLGLKTSSSSQCDKLSILTRKNNEQQIVEGTICFKNKDKKIYAEFDDPNNLYSFFDNASSKNNLPFKTNSGTIVLWSEMTERFGRTIQKKDNPTNFFDINSKIKNHLGLIFYEFIKENKVEIYVGRNNWNKAPIEYIDPFLVKEKDTIELQKDNVYVESLDGNIEIEPYIVPDIRSFPEEQREKFSSYYSWNEMQGIYIFRNKRLLSYSKWHNLKYKNQTIKEKSEKYRNLRIKISFNNLKYLENLDLTINKTKMSLPIEVSEKLSLKLDYIIEEYFRHSSIGKIKKVFVYRGQDKSLWKKNHNEYLELDRSHPLIKELKGDDNFSQKFNQLLSMLNQQQKEHNLINIVLKLNEPNSSNEDILISQMKDQKRQLMDSRILDEKEIIEVLKSLFSNNSKVNEDFIKEKVFKDE
jgi:hypothetical protein